MKAIKDGSFVREKETAMVIVLVVLLIVYSGHPDPLLIVSAAVIVSCLIFPGLYTLPMRAWFALSAFLGSILSPVILSAVFFLVVTPVGFLYRALKRYPPQFALWRSGGISAFSIRQKVYCAKDLDDPF